jgi:uncharacterized protein
MENAMPEEGVNDPILKRYRATLDEIYGQRLERVVLLGSRARGDGGEESDYDVAVFLRDMPDQPFEMKRLADLTTEILYDRGPTAPRGFRFTWSRVPLRML